MALRAIFAASSDPSYPTYGGVYISDDFTVTGAQPTWRQVNGGLPSLEVFQMRVDPFHPAERQYALIQDYGVYRRYEPETGDNWVQILSLEDAEGLTGTGISSNMKWIAPSQTTDGRILVAFNNYITSDFPRHLSWVIASEDYGETWTAYCQPNLRFEDPGGILPDVTLSLYQGIGSVEERNGYVFMAVSSSLSGCSHILIKAYPPTPTPCSSCMEPDPCDCDDCNVTCGPPGGKSGWFPALVPDEDNDGACFTFQNVDCAANGGKDLCRINHPDDALLASWPWCSKKDLLPGEDLGDFTMSDSVWYRNDRVWVDPANPLHTRIFGNNRLYYSTGAFDSGNNYVDLTGFDAGEDLCNLIGPQGDSTVVCFTRPNGSGTEVAMVMTLTNETDTSPENRSGTNFETPPYTDAIPGVVGATAHNGLWVGNLPTFRGIYTYAVELGDIGDTEGIPMHGDRGVWEDVEFPDEHARDIAEGLFTYHNDPTDPIVPFDPDTILTASGEVLVDDNGNVLIEG